MNHTHSTEVIERKSQSTRRDYGLRSKSRIEEDQFSTGGLAPSQTQRMQAGRKSYLSMAQIKAGKYIKERKKLTIGRSI